MLSFTLHYPVAGKQPAVEVGSSMNGVAPTSAIQKWSNWSYQLLTGPQVDRSLIGIASVPWWDGLSLVDH